MVSNLAVFGVISAIENKTGKVGMDDYDGLHKSNPWLSFAMTLAMFSLCRYPAVRRILQQIPDLYFGDSFRFDAPLYAFVLVALINTIISLLLTICSW